MYLQKFKNINNNASFENEKQNIRKEMTDYLSKMNDFMIKHNGMKDDVQKVIAQKVVPVQNNELAKLDFEAMWSEFYHN